MAETVSPKVAAYIQRTENALGRMKAGMIEAKHDLIEGACAVGSAFAGAYVRERYPDRKILGVELDLAGAVVAGVGAAMTKGYTRDALKGSAFGLACSVAANKGAKKGQAALAAASAAK